MRVKHTIAPQIAKNVLDSCILACINNKVTAYIVVADRHKINLIKETVRQNLDTETILQ